MFDDTLKLLLEDIAKKMCDAMLEIESIKKEIRQVKIDLCLIPVKYSN